MARDHNSEAAGISAGGFLFGSGARFAPDSDSVPIVTARWLYAGVKQGTREMVRVGPAA